MSSFDLVRTFHKIFGHPAPQNLSPEALADRKLAKLRVLLVAHELIELAQALAIDLDINYMHASMGSLSGKELEQYCVVTDGLLLGSVQPNIVAVADALGDLDYVVNGAAIAYGINLPAITEEVHASNMSKLGSDGQPILDPGTNKVVKGPNYREPDIAGVLVAQEQGAPQMGEPVGGTSQAVQTSASSGSSSSPTTASTTTGGSTPVDTGANAGEPSGELKAASTTSSELAAGTSAATAENAAVHTPQGETPSQRVAEILGEADDGHDGSVA